MYWNQNGNLVQKDEATDTNLVYNWDNKLRFAQKGTTTLALKYDPLGNRIVRNSSQSAGGKRRYIVHVSSDLLTILLEIVPCTSSLKRTYVYADAEILADTFSVNFCLRAGLKPLSFSRFVVC